MDFMITSRLLSLVFFTLALSGCYYDNEEELYPPVACDTSVVTYSQTIVPIMQHSCNTCHSSGAPSGGIVTDTYEDLSQLAKSGILWPVINHESGAIPMPQGGDKLSECNLLKIRIWIDEGSPGN